MFELGVWTKVEGVDEATCTILFQQLSSQIPNTKFPFSKKCKESSHPMKQMCYKNKLILLNSFEFLKWGSQVLILIPNNDTEKKKDVLSKRYPGDHDG